MHVILNFRKNHPTGGASEGIAQYEFKSDSYTPLIPAKGEKVIFDGYHYIIENRIFIYSQFDSKVEIRFACNEVE